MKSEYNGLSGNFIIIDYNPQGITVLNMGESLDFKEILDRSLEALSEEGFRFTRRESPMSAALVYLDCAPDLRADMLNALAGEMISEPCSIPLTIKIGEKAKQDIRRLKEEPDETRDIEFEREHSGRYIWRVKMGKDAPDEDVSSILKELCDYIEPRLRVKGAEFTVNVGECSVKFMRKYSSRMTADQFGKLMRVLFIKAQEDMARYNFVHVPDKKPACVLTPSNDF